MVQVSDDGSGIDLPGTAVEKCGHLAPTRGGSVLLHCKQLDRQHRARREGGTVDDVLDLDGVTMQRRELMQGAQVVVGTTGRVIDHITGAGAPANS